MPSPLRRAAVLTGAALLAVACLPAQPGTSPRRAQPRTAVYDVVIRGGTMYDGSGRPARVRDVAIIGDSIAAIGTLSDARGRTEVDARGLAVAPGFINMLSWRPSR